MRYDRSRSARALVLTTLAALFVPTVLAGDRKNWEAEVGTRVVHTDNFFFRAEDPTNPPPSATISTLYATGEVELDSGRGAWILGGQAAGSYTTDIPDANYSTVEASVGYKRGRTRVTLAYAYLPNRVYSEEAEGIFYDLDGLALAVRQVLARGLWAEVEYNVEQWRFDPVEALRDARSDELVGTLRVPLGSRVGVRFFGVGMRKAADSPDYDWTGYGYGLALEWTASPKFNLYARGRQREREYGNAATGDSNFERSDSILDALLNLRWNVGKSIGLGLAGNYRRGESTREDRNYDASQAGFSVYFVL